MTLAYQISVWHGNCTLISKRGCIMSDSVDFRPTGLSRNVTFSGNTQFEILVETDKICRVETIINDPSDPTKSLKIHITFNKKHFDKLTPTQKSGMELPDKVLKMIDIWKFFNTSALSDLEGENRFDQLSLAKNSSKLHVYNRENRKLADINLKKYEFWNESAHKTKSEKIKSSTAKLKKIMKKPGVLFEKSNKKEQVEPEFIYIKQISKEIPKPPVRK